MTRKTSFATSSGKFRTRRFAWTTVICDAVLLIVFIACVMLYITRNNVNMYGQNVENIQNIATANSSLIQAALDSNSHEVRRAYNYCNKKSVPDILEYLALISLSGEEYQLLRLETDVSTPTYHVYSGYSTKTEGGEYRFVQYKDTSLSDSIFNLSAEENGAISYSQSFTNQTDGIRYFAVFCGIEVSENGQLSKYYLVKPRKESVVIDQAQKSSQYSELSIAICYTDGRYLAHDNGFRSDNFYDYLYKYNGLSLDRKNEIKKSVSEDTDGSGVLKYLDYQKRDCVFAYARCSGTDNWLVVVAVPESEFASEKLLSTFPAIIIVFLLVLLVFNIYRLIIIVRELSSSVEREKVANASKSSFLSRMSHEIRTPLNAVIGYNTIAKSEMSGAKNDEQRRHAEMKVLDCLAKSEIASKHLLTVINDVLDMSAIESGKIKISNERFDFRGLITSLTTVFYSQAKDKNVSFEVVFETLTKEWFVGDQMRVNQILTNLLSNAIKFTPSGGAVKLTVTQPEPENEAHIHFEVADTGIGMNEEYLSHIWTPFEQADSSISRRFGGSGLGLSITKNLVELMNGRISVESSPGEGTAFYLDLTFESTAQPEMDETYDFGAINALVVDDDSSTCDYIRLLFNRCGVKCAAVTSGEDALKAVAVARDEGKSYTLCLIDWRMPGMDGIETIRRMREIAGENVPMVILSAYDYTEMADVASEMGVSRFISKPIFQSSLFDLLAGISGVRKTETREKSTDVDFAGARVLLAEDNAMNMEIATTILGSAGLDVECAVNGREAVEKFEASEPGAYKAILMDVHMPVMNGHEATRAIRDSSHSDAKTVPIIAMTADAFAENVAEAYASGMNGHVSKPIDIPALFAMLKRFIK